MVGEDHGRAAAEHPGVARGRADQGDRTPGPGSAAAPARRALVAQRARRTRRAISRASASPSTGPGSSVTTAGAPVQDADAGGEPQHVAHGLVDRRLLDPAVPHRGGERLAVDGLRAGHRDVEAALDAADGRAGGQSSRRR